MIQHLLTRAALKFKLSALDSHRIISFYFNDFSHYRVVSYLGKPTISWFTKSISNW